MAAWRWAVAGILLVAAAASARAEHAVPLNLRVFTTFAEQGAYDIQALFAAVATVENITSVVRDPDPVRSEVGEQWIRCSPDKEFLKIDIGSIRKGELWLFVFTREFSAISDCEPTSLAYAATCLFEDSTNTPLVGLINVCPQLNLLSRPHNQGDRQRQLNFNYRVFLHEIVHSMGMIPPVYDTMRGVTLASGWVSIITHPVVRWARDYYQCRYIMGVPFLDGHWDPYFVGEQELMTACIPENAVMSPVTLAFLDSVGPYRVVYENVGRFDVIRQVWLGSLAGIGFGRLLYGNDAPHARRWTTTRGRGASLCGWTSAACLRETASARESVYQNAWPLGRRWSCPGPSSKARTRTCPPGTLPGRWGYRRRRRAYGPAGWFPWPLWWRLGWFGCGGRYEVKPLN